MSEKLEETGKKEKKKLKRKIPCIPDQANNFLNIYNLGLCLSVWVERCILIATAFKK